MATIYEVAALAGVSPATVSRVFNGTRVTPEREARVRKAAAKLQFTPSRAARSLRRRSSEVIALIIPDIENPFFTSLARSIEDTAADAALSVVLCNTDDDVVKEKQYLQIAIAENMAGVIIVPASKRTDLSPLTSRGTPVVSVDRSSHRAHVDTVLLDNEASARLATELLYSQQFRLVGCITGPRGIETAAQRSAGWRKVFRRHHPDLAASQYLRYANYRVDGGHEAIGSLMQMQQPPDAVVIANNLMSVGALQWLSSFRRGPAVGVVSIGALPFALMTPSGVTVIDLPTRTLGKVAASLLIDRISGDGSPVRTVIIPAPSELAAPNL